MVIRGGLRSAHCRSARSRTLTAQRFGVAGAPLQRRGAWRLAVRVEVGMAVVREVVVRRVKARMAVVVKCVVDCGDGWEAGW